MGANCVWMMAKSYCTRAERVSSWKCARATRETKLRSSLQTLRCQFVERKREEEDRRLISKGEGEDRRTRRLMMFSGAIPACEKCSSSYRHRAQTRLTHGNIGKSTSRCPCPCHAYIVIVHEEFRDDLDGVSVVAILARATQA